MNRVRPCQASRLKQPSVFLCDGINRRTVICDLVKFSASETRVVRTTCGLPGPEQGNQTPDSIVTPFRRGFQLLVDLINNVGMDSCQAQQYIQLVRRLNVDLSSTVLFLELSHQYDISTGSGRSRHSPISLPPHRLCSATLSSSSFSSLSRARVSQSFAA